MLAVAKARWFLGLLMGWLICGGPGGSLAAQADDFKIKMQLIWGTDIPKPDDPQLKELDGKLTEKLSKVFRRKYYFEVDRQKIVVPVNGSKITSMSHKCVIEVQHLGETNFKVSLYGEGKLVGSVRQSLPVGHYLTLAGDIKKKENETWIVALSQETR